MRTNIEIPDDLMKEAMKASGAKTKKLAVCLGLQELVRKKKLRKLLEYRGKIDLDIDPEALRKGRAEWDAR